MISEVTRRNIFDFLIRERICWHGRIGEMEFLCRIFRLEDLPSTDVRKEFPTAREDIYQHRIRNIDWDDEWIFYDERFGLLKGDDSVLLRFLTEMLHPVVRADASEVERLLSFFNAQLSADGFELVSKERISGQPVFIAVERHAGPARQEEPEWIAFLAPAKELQDGTNVTVGTPFVCHPMSPMILPWYVPAEGKATAAWKERIKKLRDRFERLVDEFCPAECVLVQTLIPCYDKLPYEPPGAIAKDGVLWAGPGLELPPCRLIKTNGEPLCGLFPIRSVREEPMLGPDGQPLGVRLGAKRYHQIYTDPADTRRRPIPNLIELMRDGCELVFGLPSNISVSVWRNWQMGFCQRTNRGVSPWLDLLFELSWQRQRGNNGYAERFAWEGDFSIGLIGNGLFPRLPAAFAGERGIANEGGYPRAFYSKLPDVARASVAAIHEILERDVETVSKRLAPELMNRNPEPRVFISHSTQDKPFVRKLVERLKEQQLKVWFDEQEIKVGDSIPSRIADGLKDTDYLVIVLSKAAVASRWVQAELNSALMDSLSNKGTAVLPVLIDDCEIPTLLRDRLYADFRSGFNSGLSKLLAVLKQEGETAAELGATTTTTITTTLRPGAVSCAPALAALPLGELRRRITKRMDRTEVATIWFDLFHRKMDDDMANRPLVDCVIELLDRANKRTKLDQVIASICADRSDLTTA